MDTSFTQHFLKQHDQSEYLLAALQCLSLKAIWWKGTAKQRKGERLEVNKALGNGRGGEEFQQ